MSKFEWLREERCTWGEIDALKENEREPNKSSICKGVCRIEENQ
jgi:hypothetical protein